MRSLSKKQKATVAALTLLGLTSTAGIAYAYWTTNGTGDGSAATGTVVGITVNQTGAAPAGLYPGGPGVAIAGDFFNNNAGPVYITSVTATVSSVTGNGSGPIACAPSDFAIEGGNGASVNQTLVGAEVPHSATPATHVGSWSGLTVRLVDTAANQDDCKNATLNIHYVAA